MRRKLTADQVMAIAASAESGRALGQRYGVSNRTISEIRTGRRYKSVRRPIQDNSYLVGDALKRMKALPDGYCPTIVTSPPYNVGAAMTPLKYRNWQRRILAECCRVAGPRGAGDRLQSQRAPPGPRALQLVRYRPPPTASTAGRLRQKIVWDKGSWQQPGPSKYPTSLPDTYEYALLFGRPHVARARRSRLRCPALGRIWRIENRAVNNPHPAPFPVEWPCAVDWGEVVCWTRSRAAARPSWPRGSLRGRTWASTSLPKPATGSGGNSSARRKRTSSG